MSAIRPFTKTAAAFASDYTHFDIAARAKKVANAPI
jgi:hypothetical protein